MSLMQGHCMNMKVLFQLHKMALSPRLRVGWIWYNHGLKGPHFAQFLLKWKNRCWLDHFFSLSAGDFAKLRWSKKSHGAPGCLQAIRSVQIVPNASYWEIENLTFLRKAKIAWSCPWLDHFFSLSLRNCPELCDQEKSHRAHGCLQAIRSIQIVPSAARWWTENCTIWRKPNIVLSCSWLDPSSFLSSRNCVELYGQISLMGQLVIFSIPKQPSLSSMAQMNQLKNGHFWRKPNMNS